MVAGVHAHIPMLVTTLTPTALQRMLAFAPPSPTESALRSRRERAEIAARLRETSATQREALAGAIERLAEVMMLGAKLSEQKPLLLRSAPVAEQRSHTADVSGVAATTGATDAIPSNPPPPPPRMPSTPPVASATQPASPAPTIFFSLGKLHAEFTHASSAQDVLWVLSVRAAAAPVGGASGSDDVAQSEGITLTYDGTASHPLIGHDAPARAHRVAIGAMQLTERVRGPTERSVAAESDPDAFDAAALATPMRPAPPLPPTDATNGILTIWQEEGAGTFHAGVRRRPKRSHLYTFLTLHSLHLV